MAFTQQLQKAAWAVIDGGRVMKQLGLAFAGPPHLKLRGKSGGERAGRGDGCLGHAHRLAVSSSITG